MDALFIMSFLVLYVSFDCGYPLSMIEFLCRILVIVLHRGSSLFNLCSVNCTLNDGVCLN